MVFSAKFRGAVAAVAFATALTSCVTANQMAMQVGQPPKVTLDLRSLQTRRFDTLDEKALLAAGTQVMQDLGFTVTESVPEAGVLVGSKQRDAEEGGQVAAQIGLMVVFALLGSHYNPMWDKTQSIHVTLTTTPIRNSKALEVRAHFDRHLTNNHGYLWRAELVDQPEIYQEFFDKLSQSAFLEAQKL